MGFFDFFKGTKPIQQGVNQEEKQQQGINHNCNQYYNKKQNKEESIKTLNLRKDTLTVCLQKRNMRDTVARVALVMDKSGSMDFLYKNGTVQSVIERILPIGIKFDDNQEIDMWLFSDSCERLNSISENDFYNYVDREIMQNHRYWGGTNYAPVINDIVEKYAQEEPSTIPSYIIYITDGENFDEWEAEEAIKKASNHNIFFQFIGVGKSNFEFLKKLDEMDGRYIDNANFFEIRNINKITDEELYDKLMTEYPSWESEMRKRGKIK